MNYHACDLCPRMCGVDRTYQKGYCQCNDQILAARAALHMWEEPCISGVNGSGTVFFSGCSLRCCFCQNHTISSNVFGKAVTPEQLSHIFLQLQDKGAHNINLVTAAHFIPSVLKALDLAKPNLKIPVVYNSSGYERLETIDALKGYIDIYLPDFKYFDSALSLKYSHASDYFSVASRAIKRMVHQIGMPKFSIHPGSKTPIMKRGVIIRHLVLPGSYKDSIRLLNWMSQNLPKNQFYISLMSQYTPMFLSHEYPEINRRVTTYEYQKVVGSAISLDLTQGFMQQKSSAKETFTPPFNLEGL